MEIIRGYKIKYLDQVLKRKLTKFWCFWRFSERTRLNFTITSRPFKSAARTPNQISPLKSATRTPIDVSPPVPRKQAHIIHRNTHSCLEEISETENTKSTPFLHESKTSQSLFDQIRLSLQTKAGSVETKNPVAKATASKIKNAKKKLFQVEKPSARHKRTSTVPECNLAVVSSKAEKQPLFKPVSKKIF